MFIAGFWGRGKVISFSPSCIYITNKYDGLFGGLVYLVLISPLINLGPVFPFPNPP
jgi:hypothetical protein